MHKFPVGVLGASGYAGRELCHLIESHPRLELLFATAHGQRGQSLRVGGREITFIATGEAPLGDAALVFSALPHGASLQWVASARQAGAKVVDLSSDLRPGQGSDHPGEPAPYGLTELNREAVANAGLVANPGCYPTAILLALAPLLRNGLITPGSLIIANAASGVTGAGYTPRPDLLFAEVSEDFRAYGVGNEHRHLGEMRSFLADGGTTADLVFTPHLLPVARGILATIVVQVDRHALDGSLLEPWHSLYRDERFIEISDSTPALRDVVRRNTVKISVARAANVASPALILTTAIDNLVKGAAGQAVQNANLMLGLDEAIGLPA